LNETVDMTVAGHMCAWVFAETKGTQLWKGVCAMRMSGKVVWARVGMWAAEVGMWATEVGMWAAEVGMELRRCQRWKGDQKPQNVARQVRCDMMLYRQGPHQALEKWVESSLMTG
jgi:hypothetical protein